jgi:hypothetical protein
MVKLFSISLVLAGVLVPGAYTLSIEDRMRDRAIIRVSSASSDLHFLLLAVPKSRSADGNGKGIILFDSSNQIRFDRKIDADHLLSVLLYWICAAALCRRSALGSE